MSINWLDLIGRLLHGGCTIIGALVIIAYSLSYLIQGSIGAWDRFLEAAGAAYDRKCRREELRAATRKAAENARARLAIAGTGMVDELGG